MAATAAQFHQAAHAGDFETIERLFHEGVAPGCRLRYMSDVPLMIVVRELIKRRRSAAASGANQTDARAQCYQKCFDVLLGTCRANIHETNESGDSPLTFAIKAKQGDLARDMVMRHRRYGRRLRDGVRRWSSSELKLTFQTVLFSGRCDDAQIDEFCRRLMIHAETPIPNMSTRSIENCCRPEVPLCVAARMDLTSTIELLLKCVESPDDLNERDGVGRTALHYAVENYSRYRRLYREFSELVVDSLCRAGASPNTISYSGETPLYIAVRAGATRLVEKLIRQYGADPNVGQAHKFPICHACAVGNTTMISLLVSLGCRVNTVEGAPIAIGRLDEKQRQTAFDRVCMMEGYWSSQPLGIAARNFNVQLVTFLLENDASAKQLDDNGLAPLHRLMWSTTRVIDYSSGFVMNPRNFEKWTAIVDLLLENGGDIDQPSESGLTPLMHLAKALRVVSRRLPVDWRGMAQWRGVVMEMIRYLMQKGAAIRSETLDAAVVPVDLMIYVDVEGEQFLQDLFLAGMGWHLVASIGRALSDTSSNPRLCFKLLKTLVLSGQKVTAEQIDEMRNVFVSRDASAELEKFAKWAKSDLTRPPSLMRLARAAIRRRLIEAHPNENITDVFLDFSLLDDHWNYLQFGHVELE